MARSPKRSSRKSARFPKRKAFRATPGPPGQPGPSVSPDTGPSPRGALKAGATHEAKVTTLAVHSGDVLLVVVGAGEGDTTYNFDFINLKQVFSDATAEQLQNAMIEFISKSNAQGSVDDVSVLSPDFVDEIYRTWKGNTFRVMVTLSYANIFLDLQDVNEIVGKYLSPALSRTFDEPLEYFRDHDYGEKLEYYFKKEGKTTPNLPRSVKSQWPQRADEDIVGNLETMFEHTALGADR